MNIHSSRIDISHGHVWRAVLLALAVCLTWTMSAQVKAAEPPAQSHAATAARVSSKLLPVGVKGHLSQVHVGHETPPRNKRLDTRGVKRSDQDTQVTVSHSQTDLSSPGGKGKEMRMLKLQSLISQRQLDQQLSEKLLEQTNDSIDCVARNIAGGGCTKSSDDDP